MQIHTHTPKKLALSNIGSTDIKAIIRGSNQPFQAEQAIVRDWSWDSKICVFLAECKGFLRIDNNNCRCGAAEE